MTDTMIASPSSTTPDPETAAMLDCLRAAVAEALDRKRRLGHYWVEWTADGPALIGADAPSLQRAR